MALADQVRAELVAIEPRRECDCLAELSALFHSAGSLHLRGRGELSAHLDLATASLARRAFTLLRGFGVPSEIRTYRQRAFGRATRYQIHVEGDARALQVLYEGGVVRANLAPLVRPPKRLVGRTCCRAAYLRGTFLGSGSVSGPRPAHLELRHAARETADFVAAVAAAERIGLHVHERSRYVAAYAKRTETIVDFLALVGASGGALALDEDAVVAGARAQANRLANADHANLVRAGTASHAQLEALRRLERSDALRRLPAPLRETAELRLRYPSISLRELALKARPPTTKATVHRRLRRLVEIADP